MFATDYRPLFRALRRSSGNSSSLIPYCEAWTFRAPRHPLRASWTRCTVLRVSVLLSENSPKALKQNSPVRRLRIRSGGMPTTRPKAVPCRKAGTIRSECASGDGPRLRGRQDPRTCGDLGDDAGRAAESEPENRTGLRPRTLQASERGRAAVPKTQELPAHPHAVGQAT